MEKFSVCVDLFHIRRSQKFEIDICIVAWIIFKKKIELKFS